MNEQRGFAIGDRVLVLLWRDWLPSKMPSIVIGRGVVIGSYDNAQSFCVEMNTESADRLGSKRLTLLSNYLEHEPVVDQMARLA